MNVAERERRLTEIIRLACRVFRAREDGQMSSTEGMGLVVAVMGSLWIEVWAELPLSTLESRMSVIVG